MNVLFICTGNTCRSPMAEGYVNGYLYWKGDDPEDEDSGSYLIRQIYEQLKADENSPYHLPWDLEFQKDW